jgi:hypothetical protein
MVPNKKNGAKQTNKNGTKQKEWRQTNKMVPNKQELCQTNKNGTKKKNGAKQTEIVPNKRTRILDFRLPPRC